MYNHTVFLESVSKIFGSTIAVNQLDLRIPPGSIYGLIGPNGSGKTTTIRMLVGIAAPTTGNVRLFDNSDPLQATDRVGYVPEANGLIQKLKLIDHIVFLGRLRGLSKPVALRRADEMLERFVLRDYRLEKCSTLSKGMSQKVQLICAMLHEPELLVLDEPFSGLDPVNMEVVRDIIIDYKNQERTVIFSTHIMEHAEQICDSLLLISKGRALLHGSMDEVQSLGSNSLFMEFEGDASKLHELPGVVNLKIQDSRAHLELTGSADTQSVIQSALQVVRVKRFDIERASLHDIFVKAVTEDQADGEANHA